MRIHVQDQIRQRPEIAVGVERAIELLKQRVEPSRFSGGVTAEWSLAENGRNGTAVKLVLSETDGTVETTMTSDELTDATNLKWRFMDMWNTVLDQKLEHSMDRVSQMLAQIEAEEE